MFELKKIIYPVWLILMMLSLIGCSSFIDSQHLSNFRGSQNSHQPSQDEQIDKELRERDKKQKEANWRETCKSMYSIYGGYIECLKANGVTPK